MKRIFTTIAISIVFMAHTMAQQTLAGTNLNIDAVAKQVTNLGNQFCSYIEKVGTASSAKGGVSLAEKKDIVNHRVNELFWSYPERQMITTRGVNGEVTRRLLMKDYFDNLLFQSQQPRTERVVYDLFFSPMLNQDIKDFSKWKFERTLPDGSALYSNIIHICQTYYTLDLQSPTAERRTVRNVEKDVKDIKVYLLRKPITPARWGVYLGDVTRARRMKTAK